MNYLNNFNLLVPVVFVLKANNTALKIGIQLNWLNIWLQFESVTSILELYEPHSISDLDETGCFTILNIIEH
jgi:hypothetical protein